MTCDPNITETTLKALMQASKRSECIEEKVNTIAEQSSSINQECLSTFDKNLEEIRTVLSNNYTNSDDVSISTSWLLLKTSLFIDSLDAYIKNVSESDSLTPTMLADIMRKCFLLTDQLSAIGFNFRIQLMPLFSEAIIGEVRHSIDRAIIQFETEFTQIVSISIESLLLPVDDKILRISNMKPDEQLPKSIEHYPIFKIFCLHLLDSLRWIKMTKNIFSPISLCLDTFEALNISLTRVMKALAAMLNMDNNSSDPILSKIAVSFLTEVLPFFTTYCETLFPEQIVLSAAGITKSEFKDLCLNYPESVKNFRLDLRQIGDPLRGAMPALMQTLEAFKVV